MADGLGGNYEPNQRLNHGQGESVLRQREPSSFERESEENHPKTAPVGPGPLSGDRAYWAQRIGNQQMPERAPGSKRGFHHSMTPSYMKSKIQLVSSALEASYLVKAREKGQAVRGVATDFNNLGFMPLVPSDLSTVPFPEHRPTSTHGGRGRMLSHKGACESTNLNNNNPYANWLSQTGMLSAYGEAVHAKALLGEQLADRDASFGRVYDNARRVPHGLLPAPDANHTPSRGRRTHYGEQAQFPEDLDASKRAGPIPPVVPTQSLDHTVAHSSQQRHKHQQHACWRAGGRSPTGTPREACSASYPSTTASTAGHSSRPHPTSNRRRRHSGTDPGGPEIDQSCPSCAYSWMGTHVKKECPRCMLPLSTSSLLAGHSSAFMGVPAVLVDAPTAAMLEVSRMLVQGEASLADPFQPPSRLHTPAHLMGTGEVRDRGRKESRAVLQSGMQAGRKDAVSVSLWMNDMLERQHQAANAQGGEAKQAVVRADSTFLVYSIAFMELARQVSVNCQERGSILLEVWKLSQHLFQGLLHAAAHEVKVAKQSVVVPDPTEDKREQDLVRDAKSLEQRMDKAMRRARAAEEKVTLLHERVMVAQSCLQREQKLALEYTERYERTEADNTILKARLKDMLSSSKTLEKKLAGKKAVSKKKNDASDNEPKRKEKEGQMAKAPAEPDAVRDRRGSESNAVTDKGPQMAASSHSVNVVNSGGEGQGPGQSQSQGVGQGQGEGVGQGEGQGVGQGQGEGQGQPQAQGQGEAQGDRQAQGEDDSEDVSEDSSKDEAEETILLAGSDGEIDVLDETQKFLGPSKTKDEFGDRASILSLVKLLQAELLAVKQSSSTSANDLLGNLREEADKRRQEEANRLRLNAWKATSRLKVLERNMASTSEQLELLEKAKKESEHHEMSFALYREQAEAMRLELESKLEAVMAHGDIEECEKHHLFSKVKGLRSNKQFGVDAFLGLKGIAGSKRDKKAKSYAADHLPVDFHRGLLPMTLPVSMSAAEKEGCTISFDSVGLKWELLPPKSQKWKKAGLAAMFVVVVSRARPSVQLLQTLEIDLNKSEEEVGSRLWQAIGVDAPEDSLVFLLATQWRGQDRKALASTLQGFGATATVMGSAPPSADGDAETSPRRRRQSQDAESPTHNDDVPEGPMVLVCHKSSGAVGEGVGGLGWNGHLVHNATTGMYDVWEDQLGPGLDIAHLEVNYGPVPGVTSYCLEPDKDPAKKYTETTPNQYDLPAPPAHAPPLLRAQNSHQHPKDLPETKPAWSWKMEQRRIEDIMVYNMKALRHVFRYYCAVTVGSTDPWNMTLRNYENLLKGSKIKINSKTLHKLLGLTIGNNSESVEEEALDSLNLDLRNFLESLVRLADHLGKKRSKPDKKVKGRRSLTATPKKDLAKERSKELGKENSDDEEEDTSEKSGPLSLTLLVAGVVQKIIQNCNRINVCSAFLSEYNSTKVQEMLRTKATILTKSFRAAARTGPSHSHIQHPSWSLFCKKANIAGPNLSLPRLVTVFLEALDGEPPIRGEGDAKLKLLDELREMNPNKFREAVARCIYLFNGEKPGRLALDVDKFIDEVIKPNIVSIERMTK